MNGNGSTHTLSSMRKCRHKTGFTLIEMAIVLVIMGFIVGGIFLGKSLIRQSQVNSLMADEQKYVAAVLNFQQKYNALPGDFYNATTYWSSAANGSGNGQVGTGSEAFQFWLHLSDANMIQGSYTGVAGSAGSTDHVIESNCPASRVTGAGFGVNYTGIVNWGASIGDTTNYFDGNYGHALIFGSYTSNNLPVSAVLTAAEALGLDTKFDDGLPGTGTILAWKAWATYDYTSSCANGQTSTATYVASSSGPQCALIFITGF